MAWSCSSTSNAGLAANMRKEGLITSDRVFDAFVSVDRAHFSPTTPYADSPQTIGHAATISAPHMHASAAETLLPYLNPGSKVLDIGSGSGYLTNIFAALVRPGGTVIGVDHIQPLVDLGLKNTKKSPEGAKALEEGLIKFVCADGRKGWKEGAPYDVIHVGAACGVLHQELVEQLKAPGRMFVPVEEQDGMQYVFVVDKDKDGGVRRERLYGVQYVPLTDAPKV